jgi:hypothetical protein
MSKSVKITIPNPCHENWANMTPEGRGRFCAACQKTVVDFTNATDREIVTAYKKEASLCGRFRQDQLNRQLAQYNRPSPWATGIVATVGLLALSVQPALSQTPETEQTPTPQTGSVTENVPTQGQFVFNGIITESEIPVSDVTVKNKNSGIEVISDIEGKYSILANEGDSIEFSWIGMETFKITAKKNEAVQNIKIDDHLQWMGEVIVVKNGTWVGNFFRWVGRIFN